ncbi:MAG: O-antigen ligase family protein, partial [Campylobacterota bacterium]|nr:O-antigen ligase family protein [Campylobacterota bacterium]
MGTLINKINFDRSYYYLLLALAFVMPLSRAAISLFVVSLLILWIIEGNWKKKLEFVNSSPVLKAMGIFIGYMTLTILWSSNTGQALDEIRMFGYWIIIPIIAMNIQRKNFNNVLTSFLLGMLVSEIISYGIYFEILSLEGVYSTNPTPFMNHIEYSVFLGLSAVILIYRILLDEYTKKEKIFMFLFFLSILGTLFITQGRMGQIAFLLSIIVMFVLHYKVTLKSIMLSFGFIFVLLTSFYEFSSNFKITYNKSMKDIEKINNGQLTSSIGIRLSYWLLAYDILKENPFGVGIGDMDDDKVPYVDKMSTDYELRVDFLKENYFHNQFLQLLVAGGYLGLILFMNILFQLCKSNIYKKEYKDIIFLFIA